MILRAEARRTVEIMSINSMRLSLMLGGQVDYEFDPRLNTYLDDVDILATDAQSGQFQVEGASGFLQPHSPQNLAEMPLLPQLGQSQVWGASGFFTPHSGQNLLWMFFMPQFGQSQVSAALGSGFLLPHSGQNLL